MASDEQSPSTDDPRLRPGMAIRHPRRGKAHRAEQYPGATGSPRVGTACGLPALSVERYSETVPVSQTTKEGRCSICFKA